MNQMKLLKLKIQHSNMLLDQNRVLYHQSKETLHQSHNKLMMPLLCLGAFGFTFTWAFLGKFHNPISRIYRTPR